MNLLDLLIQIFPYLILMVVTFGVAVFATDRFLIRSVDKEIRS